jgi:hypothetical protein
MKGTFTLPDGSRVRVGSQRRYVVVSDRWQDTGFRVEARSDSLDTILTRWRAMARGNRTYSHHVIDTETKEVIR